MPLNSGGLVPGAPQGAGTFVPYAPGTGGAVYISPTSTVDSELLINGNIGTGFSALKILGQPRAGAGSPPYCFQVFSQNPSMLTNAAFSLVARSNINVDGTGQLSFTIAGQSSYIMGVQSDVGSSPTIVIQTDTGDFTQYYDRTGNLLLKLLPGGQFQTAAANESTGSGSAALGSNCPAVTATGPYTWEKITTSDGSQGYFPVWK